MAGAIISPEAPQDMRGIHNYITMDDPDAADRVVQALKEMRPCWQHSQKLGSTSLACAACDYGWLRSFQIT